MTYGSLAKEAEKLAAKPRDVLADAEEIATKRQRLADIRDPETALRKAGLEKMLDKVEALPDEPMQETPLSMSEASKSDSDSVNAEENLTLAEELTPGTATDEP